jgi:hypothetical protein
MWSRHARLFGRRSLGLLKVIARQSAMRSIFLVEMCSDLKGRSADPQPVQRAVAVLILLSVLFVGVSANPVLVITITGLDGARVSGSNCCP